MKSAGDSKGSVFLEEPVLGRDFGEGRCSIFSKLPNRSDTLDFVP